MMAGRVGMIRRLLDEESGQDLLEYALIAMMIGLAAVGAFSGLGGIIASKWSAIVDAF